VSTCLLWENTFYEPGSGIAARIAQLCGEVPLADVARLAVTARTELKLRHVPLFLAVQLARRNSATKAKSGLVSETIAEVIQRPDEIGEFLSLYWREARQPLAKQVKRGWPGPGLGGPHRQDAGACRHVGGRALGRAG
jgi:hypothetical protein